MIADPDPEPVVPIDKPVPELYIPFKLAFMLLLPFIL